MKHIQLDDDIYWKLMEIKLKQKKKKVSDVVKEMLQSKKL